MAVSNNQVGSKKPTKSTDNKQTDNAIPNTKRQRKRTNTNKKHQPTNNNNSNNNNPPNIKLGVTKAHKAITGSSSFMANTNPNLIFLLGGSLILASQWTTIKTAFKLIWTRPTPQTTNSTKGALLAIIKKIGVLTLFVTILTMMARIIKPLGGVWLTILVGLWILYLMRNPQVLLLLASLGGNVSNITATNNNQQMHNELTTATNIFSNQPIHDELTTASNMYNSTIINNEINTALNILKSMKAGQK